VTNLPQKPAPLPGLGWVVMAILVWGVLLTGVAIHAYLYPWSHTVYDIYAPAARNWWAGEDMYVRRLDYFRYSPLFAVALTPFAVLPDSWGGALWKVLNCAVYAAGLWTWARRALPTRLSRSELAGLFLLALPISMHSIYNGQANLVMLGAILFAFAALAAERCNRAAGWLAVATLVKGYPLALALVLSVLYPRRLAGRFALALGIGLLLPFALQRPAVVAAQYASWFGHMRASTGINRERQRTVDTLVQIYYGRLPDRVPAALGLAAGAAVLGLCLARARRHTNRRTFLVEVYLLFATWVVLFGPATETCTYVVIGPAVAWAVLDECRRPGAWVARSATVLCLLLMGPLATDLFGSRVRCFATDHGTQPLGALLFAAYLVHRFRREVRPARTVDSPGSPALDKAA
jgi:hypothetical protein